LPDFLIPQCTPAAKKPFGAVIVQFLIMDLLGLQFITCDSSQWRYFEKSLTLLANLPYNSYRIGVSPVGKGSRFWDSLFFYGNIFNPCPL
jgi:hypothetical protein